MPSWRQLPSYKVALASNLCSGNSTKQILFNGPWFTSYNLTLESGHLLENIKGFMTTKQFRWCKVSAAVWMKTSSQQGDLNRNMNNLQTRKAAFYLFECPSYYALPGWWSTTPFATVNQLPLVLCRPKTRARNAYFSPTIFDRKQLNFGFLLVSLACRALRQL